MSITWSSNMRQLSIFMLFIAGGLSNLAAGDLSPVTAQLDSHFTAAWKEANLTPAEPATDAAYLRRVYLDIAGTLPPPEKIRAFLLDPSPDKRATVVDDLLKSPQYASR